jgi:hypothetical protein
MPIEFDHRERHDARARELGFVDRKAMRQAMHAISETMSPEEYMQISEENMETLLREYALQA